MFGLGPLEIVVIGALAVMLYGKKLPEVGRSVGQSIAELRKQWTTISRDLDVSAHLEGRDVRPARPARRFDDDVVGAGSVSAPRFDPPADPPAA
ncbi:MAG: twin-arginine translocase TatA/TatE family subunit [Planctomycetia bacterium]|nr:twin-arginine translocase TatA/TatE family subunit [Planctomycetia bacterium]